MTRTVHDKFAKEWLQELLVDFGEVEIELQISAEVRKVDVYLKPKESNNPAPETIKTIEHLARLQMTLQARQNESRLFKEVAMNLAPVYDEWKEKTLAEGISLGKKQGISLGQAEVIKHQLKSKLQRLSPVKLAAIDPLNPEQLSSLAIALLSFETEADFDAWCSRHATSNYPATE